MDLSLQIDEYDKFPGKKPRCPRKLIHAKINLLKSNLLNVQLYRNLYQSLSNTSFPQFFLKFLSNF